MCLWDCWCLCGKRSWVTRVMDALCPGHLSLGPPPLWWRNVAGWGKQGLQAHCTAAWFPVATGTALWLRVWRRVTTATFWLSDGVRTATIRGGTQILWHQCYYCPSYLCQAVVWVPHPHTSSSAANKFTGAADLAAAARKPGLWTPFLSSSPFASPTQSSTPPFRCTDVDLSSISVHWTGELFLHYKCPNCRLKERYKGVISLHNDAVVLNFLNLNLIYSEKNV